MNRTNSLLASLSIAALCLTSSIAHAVPARVPIQLYIEDATTSVPVDGERSVTLRLYSSIDDVDAIYTETQDNVLFVDGESFVFLEDGGTLDPALFAGRTTLFLGIEIDSDGEGDDRLSIGSVPYALVAETAGDANSVGGLVSSDLQQRVDGTCNPGDFITAINEDGTVVCDTPVGGGGGVIAVVGTNGVTSSESSGVVTVAADTDFMQRRVTGNCTAGSFVTAVEAGGGVSCATPEADITSIVAGDGLTVDATSAGLSGDVTLDVDDAVFQRRIGADCAAGDVVIGVAGDGTLNCEASGVDDLQQRVTGTCEVGESVTGVNANGSLVCLPLISDWIDGNCTSSWTGNTTTTCKYRRVGDSAEIDLRISLQGPPTPLTLLRVSLPSGLEIDTSKATSSGVFKVWGNVVLTEAGVRFHGGAVAGESTTQVAVLHNGSANGGNVNTDTPFAFDVNDAVSATFTVPVIGWSTGVTNP